MKFIKVILGFILLSICVMGAWNAGAELIRLKSGQEVRGKIVKETPFYIKVAVERSIQTKEILKSDIRSIEANDLVKDEETKNVSEDLPQVKQAQPEIKVIEVQPKVVLDQSAVLDAAFWYQKAMTQIEPLPVSQAQADQIINSGWKKKDDALAKYVENNPAVASFKKAANLRRFSASMLTQTNQDFQQRLNLLTDAVLLQARWYEFSGMVDFAVDNYVKLLKMCGHLVYGSFQTVGDPAQFLEIIDQVYSVLSVALQNENLIQEDIRYAFGEILATEQRMASFINYVDNSEKMAAQGTGKKAQTQLSHLILLSAVSLYEIEQGRFPKSLDDLVPDYLAERPKAVTYTASRKGYQLVSVGLFNGQSLTLNVARVKRKKPQVSKQDIFDIKLDKLDPKVLYGAGAGGVLVVLVIIAVFISRHKKKVAQKLEEEKKKEQKKEQPARFNTFGVPPPPKPKPQDPQNPQSPEEKK